LGLGPGDPELLTLKALRLLRMVPTLFVPVRRPGDSGYAWTIAEPHLEPGRQQIVRLPFPQERGAVGLDQQWDRNAELIRDQLRGGGDAAFLTEGDPLLYSTFAQVAGRLRSLVPELPIEVVPAVTSITAAAAAAGAPLVSRGGRLAVLPAVYDLGELRQTLRAFDTVVLLKVNRVLDQIAALLAEEGLGDKALLVERCGRPEQRIARGLAELTARPADYFSLVVVSK
jgi:precorrin-2/cobalt-factor-2 C20-methyltransferase